MITNLLNNLPILILLILSFILLLFFLSILMKKANIKKIQITKNGLDLEREQNYSKEKGINVDDFTMVYLSLLNKYENFAKNTVEGLNTTNNILEENFSSIFNILSNISNDIKMYSSMIVMIVQFFNNIKNNFMKEISYTFFQSLKNEIFKIIFDSIDRYYFLNKESFEDFNTKTLFNLIQKKCEFYNKQIFLVFSFFKSEEYVAKLEKVFAEFLINLKDILNIIDELYINNNKNFNFFKEELKNQINKLIDQLSFNGVEIIKEYIEEYIKYCEENINKRS